MAQTFDDVRITFLTPDEEPSDYVATIVTRDREMVLEIPRQHAGGPYLVRGRAVEHFFAGMDDLRDAARIDVSARWTLLGDVWVGVWFEDGTEYLFSFRLPSSCLVGR